MTRLHFISLGCPKNLVDSEVMLGLLTKAGFVITGKPSDAQIIIVNTCAFIEDAKKEAIDTILEMGRYKGIGSCQFLIVAGCLPQRYKDEIRDLLPEVDLFVGAGEFPKIAEMIKKIEKGQKVCVGEPLYIYDHETPRLHTAPSHTAFLKIAEGCNHPCSFCVVPKIRGQLRSRPVGSIVAEARDMLSKGVREINIIAQDTTAYGRDIGTNIVELLGELAELGGPKWLRLLYTYPHNFPLGLLMTIGQSQDICRYIDMPIQHISDRILKAMGRRSSADVREIIKNIRQDLPGAFLRTSLISGFPGETQREHDELIDFVCETRFEHLGVFVFSPEEGTPAARLKNRVPNDVAEARRQEIMEVQREISLGNNFQFLGKKISVLIEGPSNKLLKNRFEAGCSKSARCKAPDERGPKRTRTYGEGLVRRATQQMALFQQPAKEKGYLLEGRHEGQAPDVDGIVYIDEGEAKAGEFVDVLITEAHEYDLVGRIELGS